MKKILVIIILMILVASFVSACGSSSSASSGSHVGVYHLHNNFLELQDNGTVVYGATGSSSKYIGKYEISGNVLKIRWDNYTPSYEEDTIENGVITDSRDGRQFVKQ